jgi:hypothetical protein
MAELEHTATVNIPKAAHCSMLELPEVSRQSVLLPLSVHGGTLRLADTDDDDDAEPHTASRPAHSENSASESPTGDAFHQLEAVGPNGKRVALPVNGAS